MQDHEACYAVVGDCEEAQRFFSGILNGAGMCHLETFMQKHQLQKLPHFVSELMHEIRAIAQRDAQAYPELSAELAAQGGNWKGQLLELLHEIQEHGGFRKQPFCVVSPD